MSLDLTAYKRADSEVLSGAQWNECLGTIETGVNNIVQDQIVDFEVTSTKLAANAVIGSALAGTNVKPASIGSVDIASGSITSDNIQTGLDLSGSKNGLVETAAKVQNDSEVGYSASEIGVVARAECDIVPYDDGSDPHWDTLLTYGVKYTIKASDALLGITDGVTPTLPDDYEVSIELDHGIITGPQGRIPIGPTIREKTATDFTIYIMGGKFDGSGPFIDPVTGAMSTNSEGCHMTVSVTAKR
jgi:hypothetical protein